MAFRSRCSRPLASLTRLAGKPRFENAQGLSSRGSGRIGPEGVPAASRSLESHHRFHSVQTTDVHVCDPKISDGRVSVLDYATTPVFLSLRLDEQTLFSVVRFGLVSPAG
jgi:hypothetical protein